ncbi:MAG: hypothetical protein ACYS99_23425, partial [Planctomycetota bacterium]
HRESLRESAREASDRGLKQRLILDRIAEAEGIDVTDGELEEQIRGYAIARGKTPVTVRSELEREDRLDDLRAEILSAKTVNFIVEHADITDAQGGPAAEGAGDSPEGGAQ